MEGKSTQHRRMEEAAENGTELSHSAHANEWMNEWMNGYKRKCLLMSYQDLMGWQHCILQSEVVDVHGKLSGLSQHLPAQKQTTVRNLHDWKFTLWEI